MNPTSTPWSSHIKLLPPGLVSFSPPPSVKNNPAEKWRSFHDVTKSDISSSQGLPNNIQKEHLARGMIWIFALISTIRRHEVIPVTGTNKLDNTERIDSSTGEDVHAPLFKITRSRTYKIFERTLLTFGTSKWNKLKSCMHLVHFILKFEENNLVKFW